MSKHALQPMDSYRLAQYSVQVPCYICGGGNAFDTELCRHCLAPMALSHQARSQKTPPEIVATIGSAKSGKTVYLGILTDILTRQNEDLQLLARGAFSVSLQQTTIAALANCRFPDKTPCEPDRWNWVHCQVKQSRLKRPIELVIPDLAGEAILEEIDHPNTYPVIRLLLNRCAGVMVLVDAARLEKGEHDQDFLTMKIVSYLCELDGNRKTGWPNRPVSLVFTKSDQNEACFDDPSQYARKHTPGLWQQCHERLRRHRFFASGVAGASGYHAELQGMVHVPLRIEPRGVVEPFRWLIEQIGK